MKKKERPEKRRRTDEELSRAADSQLKRYIAKAALEAAEKEPEVRRQMIAKTFGYHIPDETEKSFNELVAYIDKKAIDQALNNPLSKFSRINRELGRLIKIRTRIRAFHPNAEQHVLMIAPEIFSV